jgi:hypothetical protein
MIDTAVFQNTSVSASDPSYTSSPTLCVSFTTGQVQTSSCGGASPVRCVH